VSDTPTDPAELIRRAGKSELPKRFFKLASAEPADGGFVVKLDGRAIKTPGRKPLAVGSAAVAQALAGEWNALGEHIDPGRLPLTRIANAAIDRVAEAMPAVRDEVLKYAGSDLICYRAAEPPSLVEAQEAQWGPLVAFAREALGARLVLAEGIVHVPQDAGALAAIERALAPFDPLELAAVSTITSITGSAVMALALAHGAIDPDAAWQAAFVDEDWQAERWGEDAIAMARRAAQRKDFDAAAVILRGGSRGRA
jgi:chaperone required for assembly of F1-ATPase